MKKVFVIQWQTAGISGFDWYYKESDAQKVYDDWVTDGDLEKIEKFPFIVTSYEVATDEIDVSINSDRDESNDERPFTLDGVNQGFNEAEYLHLQEMIRMASTLFGDGGGGDLGKNTEYERGISEFICRTLNISDDEIDAVTRAIHDQAIYDQEKR